ncbi:hypothetical protein FDB30_11440 [Clostridium botulinum]|uniref:hypothetical protein n=1 Tax=Clostridium botulinum TaxID=1491 RepID=UPI0007742D4B|nr:hypothetical protein [Clostridium botulinum]MBN1048291.1 hypothetical protein [Clostridium botulinum]MBN1077287.1 hypothetical protein [Clostridium botulinum]NFE84761.1 hypothetical protein [Clostridium botulinum]NFG38497.1 hypothetical protein [Clostridium botulinum]NFN28262.1 hypothetical protein [Clostridium botulinum]
MGRKYIEEPQLNEKEIFVNKPNYSASTKDGEKIGNYILSDGKIAKIFFNNVDINAPQYTIISADKEFLDYIIKNYTITYDESNIEAISRSDGYMKALHYIITGFYYKNKEIARVIHKSGDSMDNLDIKIKESA